jgi:hypothetical protein
MRLRRVRHDQDLGINGFERFGCSRVYPNKRRV